MGRGEVCAAQPDCASCRADSSSARQLVMRAVARLSTKAGGISRLILEARAAQPNTEAEAKRADRPHSDLIARVRTAIDDLLGAGTPVAALHTDDVIKVTGYSRSYMCRQIRHQTGMTFVQYKQARSLVLSRKQSTK